MSNTQHTINQPVIHLLLRDRHLHCVITSQDELADMADLTNEINTMMGQTCYAIPDDVDEEDLMHELDALEDDLAAEPAMGATPSYLQVGVWLCELC